MTFRHVVPLGKHGRFKELKINKIQIGPSIVPTVQMLLRKDIIYLRKLFGRNIYGLVFILGAGSNLGLEIKSSAPKLSRLSSCSLFFSCIHKLLFILQGNRKGERRISTHVN